MEDTPNYKPYDVRWKMNVIYLNNSGHRWKIPNAMKFALYNNGQFVRIATADFYEAFGNFAICHFRSKGIRYSGLFRDCEKHREEFPIIDLEKCRIFQK